MLRENEAGTTPAKSLGPTLPVFKFPSDIIDSDDSLKSLEELKGICKETSLNELKEGWLEILGWIGHILVIIFHVLVINEMHKHC